MTISTEERLERVERLVEANSQAIARLTQQEEVLRRIDRLSGDSEKLSERVEKLSGDVEKLSGDVEKLSSDVEKLTFKFDTSQTIGGTAGTSSHQPDCRCHHQHHCRSDFGAAAGGIPLKGCCSGLVLGGQLPELSFSQSCWWMAIIWAWA
jgi:outer membrane murein-binding lipoprotein Lpp